MDAELRQKLQNLSEEELQKLVQDILGLDDESKDLIDEDTQKVAEEFGRESPELETTSGLQTMTHEKTDKIEQAVETSIDKCNTEREKYITQINNLKEEVADKDKVITEQDSIIKEMKNKEANKLSNKIKTMYRQEVEKTKNTLNACKEFATTVNNSVKQFVEKRHELGVFLAANNAKLAIVKADLKFERANRDREINEMKQGLQMDKRDLSALQKDLEGYEKFKESAKIKAVSRGIKLNKFRPKRFQKTEEEIENNFKYKYQDKINKINEKIAELSEKVQNREAEINELETKMGTHELDSRIADLERQKAEIEAHIEVGENARDERKEARDERRAERQEARDNKHDERINRKQEKEIERHKAKMGNLDSKRRGTIVTPVPGEGGEGGGEGSRELPKEDNIINVDKDIEENINMGMEDNIIPVMEEVTKTEKEKDVIVKGDDGKGGHGDDGGR